MTDPAERPRPTMRDVAREAGVSQSLVSIIFRDAAGASDATREKVLEAANRLGYVRNESARALRVSSPNTIGVTFNTRQPFHHELLDGLYAATANTRYQLVLSAVSEHRSESEAVETLLSYRSGALILLGCLLEEERLGRLSRRMPVITVAQRSVAPGVDWVVSDDDGMNLATSHLMELGHTKIRYLSCSEAAGGQDRLAAFERAIDVNGLQETAYSTPDGGKDEASGASVAEAIVRSGDLPTAIIAFNDRCALGLIDVLIRCGVSVPADVSVIGFDDSEIASRPGINMTSVHQSPRDLARFAAERAIHRLDSAAISTQARGTILPTSLTVRGSTGPVRTATPAPHIPQLEVPAITYRSPHRSPEGQQIRRG
ncbi:LacI family DNA-binding transcriptional regulator [Ancrocorticia sp.]|uniref:LacI family DNA-binding transcriptional regulator n=1 Tax=Ancrocorticia sp. TaxID=2593684 RepID=UPI003F93559F